MDGEDRANCVIVELAADEHGGWQLLPGDQLTLGRTGGGAEAELSSEATVSGVAAVLRATPESVWICNTSTYATLELRDRTPLSTQALSLPPSVTLLCPFSHARLIVPVGGGDSTAIDLTVSALAWTTVEFPSPSGTTRELGHEWRELLIRRNASGQLRGRLNWLTVVALCEPLLVGSDRTPTALSIARRISWAERDRTPATTDAIAQRLHRVRQRLGLPNDLDPEAGQRLAKLLVSRSVVRPSDLTDYLDGDDD